MSVDRARYAAATHGHVSFGIESNPYTQASDPDQHFGLLDGDVSFPNENPVTSFAGAGRRGPHVNSPDPRSYSFDVGFAVQDANAPLEVALGERTTTSQTDYDEHVFTEATILPTMTVEHRQTDIGLTEWFVGCKADLDLEAQQGDPLSATLSLTGASREYDTNTSPGPIEEPELSPYRFSMLGDVMLGSTHVANVSGVNLSWSNGLEADNHGSGRDAYKVKETTSGDKYDMSITAGVVDTSAYVAAAENDAPVDVEVPFYRDSGPDYADALIVRLLDCTVTDAPIPKGESGDIEQEIGLQPRNTEIEIREPTA